LPTLKLPSFSVNTDSESSEYEFKDDMKNDPDFLPDSSSVNSSMPNISPDRPYLCNEDLHSEPKYIVFWSCLLQLFTWLCCPNCGMKGMGSSKHVIGTLLLIKFTCHQCGAVNSWKSQPSIGNFSAGNILLSGAILYSGCVARKVLRVFQNMGVATIKMRTFFYHQQQILLPTIYKVWKTNQEKVLQNLILKESLVLGGDGRADSPGHSAKYGTYSMIELETNKVIDIQLVQVNIEHILSIVKQIYTCIL
jgi:solute carrier family 8 (sodium/calcium exchanger)